MAQPTPYERKYDLSNDDGMDLRTQADVELDDVARCFLETLTNLALIQRDDGQLANRSVGVEQLKAELIAGFNPPAPFQPYRVYEVSDSFVTDAGKWYIVNTAFTATADPADNINDITLVYDFAAVRTDSLAAKDAAEAAQAAAELARDQAAASASNADTSEANAAASASNAASSASNAKTSETNAKTSETNAKTSETNAAAAEAAAVKAFDDFDDRYLGQQATPPTTDNDGNTLREGAMYWDTASPGLYVWDGSAWQANDVVALTQDASNVNVTSSTGTQALGDALDQRVIYVGAIADLQALDTTKLSAGQAARIASTGRAGDFVWKTGDQSANVTADPQRGVWVAPDSDATGVSGAWMRSYNHWAGLDARWFGFSEGHAGAATPVNDCISYASANGVPRVAATNLGAVSLSSAITPQDGVTLDMSGTTLTASAEMTALITKIENVDNWHVIGGVLDANAQPNTGCIQHTLGYVRNVSYKGTEVKGTVGAWQVKIGYAEGSSTTPGDEASNLPYRSYDVLLEDMVFGDHSTTSLEQLIIVNAERVDVVRAQFRDNTTITFCALVFAYSENIRFVSPVFDEFTQRALGVQQSTNVKVLDPEFKTSGVTPNSLVQVVNSFEVHVVRPTADIYAPVDGGPVALALYNFAGTHFEGGNLANKHDRCRDVYISDAPSLKGCFGILQAPFQSQADKSFRFERIGSYGNNAESLTGSPYVIGAYTVQDAATQAEGIADVLLNDTVVNHQSATSGSCLIRGTSTSSISRVYVLSDISASLKANNRSVVVEHCDELTVRGNHRVSGVNPVVDLASTVRHFDVDINANKHFITRGSALGRVRGIGVRSDDVLETMQMENRQGATIPQYAPVILRSDAQGDQITMTTTADDHRAVGITAQASNDLDYIYVVTKGVIACKTNGVVAEGDRLATSATAGEAAVTASTADAIAIATGSSAGGSATVNALVGWRR